MRASGIFVAIACLIATACQAIAAGSEPDGAERLWQLNSGKLSTTDSGREQRHYEGSLPDAQELEQLLAREATADPEDLYRLGLAYENTNLWTPDYKKAFSYFERSERLGFPWAKAQLGYYYETGLAGEKDYKKAASLYRKSADSGDPYALTALGILYRDGSGVPQDFDEANRLFQEAISRGLIAGKANFGWMLLHGLGVPVDEMEGFALIEEAAAVNDHDGTYYLAVLLEKGEVVEGNLQRAVELYEQSAEQGNFLAQAALERLGN